MRSLQIPTAKMHTGLRFRALLSSRGAAQIRQRAQNLRRKQRQQASQ